LKKYQIGEIILLEHLLILSWTFLMHYLLTVHVK